MKSLRTLNKIVTEETLLNNNYTVIKKTNYLKSFHLKFFVVSTEESMLKSTFFAVEFLAIWVIINS